MRRCLAQVILCGLLFGCGGVREQFLGTRVKETCNGTWPVCDRIAGCLVGDSSYLEGKFPNQGKVGFHVFETSKVTVSLLLEDVSAAGEETVFSFWESSCRSRIRVAVTGRELLGESERQGFVKREVELSGDADHLLEFNSDAQGRYLLKLDVKPVRLASEGEL